MATSQTPQPMPHRVQQMAARRAATVPAKLQTHISRQTPVEIGAPKGIETLFTHPSARIVSFTTSTYAPTPSARRQSEGMATTLSWTTPTERTLAVGPLEIYRVPGSVSFLHSGPLLHAILPRSQCWCVDGVSVFVFRVLPNQYYRIELPGETEDDMARVEDLKATFQEVLYYERTACPFKRGFSVDILDTPTPSPKPKIRSVPAEPAKRWKLDGVWRPEDFERLMKGAQARTTNTDESVKSNLGGQRDTLSSHADQGPYKSTSVEGSTPVDNPDPRSAVRPWSVATTQALFEQPLRSGITTLVADDHRDEPNSDSSTESATAKVAASKTTISASIGDGQLKEQSREDAARTDKKTPAIQRGQEVVSPTEDTMSDGIGYMTLVDKVDQTTARSEAPIANTTSASSCPATGDSANTNEIFSEDDIVEIKHGWASVSTPSLSSEDESLAPDSSSSTIRVPEKQPPTPDPLVRTPTRQTNRYRNDNNSSSTALVTTGLVRRTVGLCLGPPAALVGVMLKIAGRFGNHGLFDSFMVRSPIGSPHRVPGSWYLADEADWDVDGYGFAARVPPLLARRQTKRNSAGDWDVD